MGARRYGISVVRAFNSTAHEWALKVSDVSAADWLYQHVKKYDILAPPPTPLQCVLLLLWTQQPHSALVGGGGGGGRSLKRE